MAPTNLVLLVLGTMCFGMQLEAKPRWKKTFVPFTAEPNIVSTYNFLYEKHMMIVKRYDGKRHFHCWLYNATAEDIARVHTKDGLSILEAILLEKIITSEGKILTAQESSQIMTSRGNRLCHLPSNNTVVRWLH